MLQEIIYREPGDLRQLSLKCQQSQFTSFLVNVKRLTSKSKKLGFIGPFVRLRCRDLMSLGKFVCGKLVCGKKN